MLDICLLGTGGMMPLPRRFLTSMLARYNGTSLLIDCGEGTQVALAKAGFSPKPIDIICITHFHADHVSGLPGMLLNMANADKTSPLLMIGPRGLSKLVSYLCVIAPELPFDINFIEIDDRSYQKNVAGYQITAFRTKHNVICYGYSIQISRAGRFDPIAAGKLPIPVNFWGKLQRGQTVTYEGKTYTPDMVMGDSRRGLKVTYTTDTRPTETIVSHAKDSDLFICEGMYAGAAFLDKAKKYRHMTFEEAAMMAKKAEVSELWLTHFSPSLADPRPFIQNARDIFPDTHLGKDGKYKELCFIDEETA